MTKRAQKIMEAFYKDETWDKEPLPDDLGCYVEVELEW